MPRPCDYSRVEGDCAKLWSAFWAAQMGTEVRQTYKRAPQENRRERGICLYKKMNYSKEYDELISCLREGLSVRSEDFSNG